MGKYLSGTTLCLDKNKVKGDVFPASNYSQSDKRHGNKALKYSVIKVMNEHVHKV